jgi:hypothetical protein
VPDDTGPEDTFEHPPSLKCGSFLQGGQPP